MSAFGAVAGAALSGQASGAISWTSPDSTCTVPAAPGHRLEMPAIYRAGAESGYIEIIAMGARGRASADCPGRPARVPGYGGFFCVYRGRPGVHAAAAIKAGGRNAYVDSGDVLKVSYFIRDNATGVEFGDNAVRVSGFLAEAAITNQQYGVLSGDLNGLGFLEAFRTLCVSPPAEMKVLMDDMGILEKVGA